MTTKTITKPCFTTKSRGCAKPMAPPSAKAKAPPSSWVLPALPKQQPMLRKVSSLGRVVRMADSQLTTCTRHLQIKRAVSPLQLPEVGVKLLPPFEIRDFILRTPPRAGAVAGRQTRPKKIDETDEDVLGLKQLYDLIAKTKLMSQNKTDEKTDDDNDDEKKDDEGDNEPIPLIELPASLRMVLPPPVAHALVTLASAHAFLAKEDKVSARVAITRGTPCPKWHVDRVKLRGLCTMYGPGSVVWDATAEQEVCGEPGDFMFLRGASPDGSTEHVAALHRSPIVDDSVTRIVVQTDCVREDEDYVEYEKVVG